MIRRVYNPLGKQEAPLLPLLISLKRKKKKAISDFNLRFAALFVQVKC